MNYFALSQILLAFIFIHTACTDHLDEVYPFLVKIEAEGKILVCAGTILTYCTVLTSAHCVEGVEPSKVTVTHFSAKVTRYKVASTVIHPKYNSTVLANDIALLQTEENFKQPWAPVILNNLAKEKVFVKCNFFQIVGWSGQIMRDFVKNDNHSNENVAFLEKPMRAPIKLISNKNCTTLMQNFGGIFQEEKLCGVTNEEEEGCFTGPGGPLLCSFSFQNSKERSPKRNSVSQKFHFADKTGTLADPIDLLENLGKSRKNKFKREIDKDIKNLQVGVVSWGKSCSKVPSVYIKTDFYYKWIAETTKSLTEKCDSNFGNFTFLTPLSSRGGTFSYFPIFSKMFFSLLIIILLQFL